ncbi:HAD-IC family P-type ATPase [Candidatus Saccharibacteria bacterium]|nr:HAD-IC family P-type ATPase [Candidatus Saccharibacteria bacterium]
MSLKGLTEAKVQARIKEGRVNQTTSKNTNTIGKIILTNTLTIFNLVNLILALMIISVGAYKNLLFILIAIANTLISIINGIRAKKTIDKMRLKSDQQPTVIREGKPRQINQDQIVDGDLLVLSLGDQIIVDAKVEEGQVEVNESYITGEQDNVLKRKGDKLISGSFVVSGTCKATATAVGAESQLSKIEQSAHTIKTADSKLFRVINNIVKYISFALIPIGALLLWARFNVPDTTPEVAVTSTVAGLISMIPEGLVLLTSSVLALATIRLSQRQVLVQDLYSIETLARVDTICLDKTGTLTTGKMKVKEFLPVKDGKLLSPVNIKHPQTPAEKSLLDALMAILSAQESDNATSTALKEKLPKIAKFKLSEPITEVIPFSSDRKHSGVKTKKSTLLMGALEFMTDNKDYLKLEQKIEGNYRIISVMENKKLLGFALLEDELRSDAKEIINYFYNNDVDVKIISGDNLHTVESIATAVGVRNISGIDLSTIKGDIDYEKLVQTYNIFTRVKPAQKKSLVLALKNQDKTVAMTGDGVNDILAMKEADCSIAIGEGADAARKSAKLVLLDNDFAGVPKVIDEGRQSINNLERSATLFLSKNTYAAILAVLFIIIPVEYPYAPLEMSLLNFACIGLPGIILALEKNTARIKNKFTTNILQYSVPTGITVAITMLIFSIIAQNLGYTRPELITTSLIVTFAIDFLLIYSIARPLNPLRTVLLIFSTTVIVLAIAIPFTRNFLDFTLLGPDRLLLAAALIVGAYIIFALMRLAMVKLTPKILKNPRLRI